nr:hypothetical protein [Bacteroidota bacterium]
MKNTFWGLKIKIRAFLHTFLLRYLAKPESQQIGYNVFGYFSKIIGQGEVARGFVDSLIRKGEKFVLLDFFDSTHKPISRLEENKYRKYYFKKFKYRTNIFFIDLTLLKLVMNKFPVLFENKENIVAFWWEFESGFEDRIPVLNEFSEVYVFSDFIKNILTSVEGRKFNVTKIKYPFVKNWIIEDEALTIRKKYNLEGKFCFFFNFDYLSSYNRKNPEAILRALAEEFPTEDHIVLVFKTNNSMYFEEKEINLVDRIKKMGFQNRAIIIKDHLSRNGFMTLLNAMDCYISLHRGEGLGLGILEAI